MRRAERLYRLIDEMRGRGACRAADLAAALEVSTRTVYRDVAHLQASGVPIDGAAGVGYLLRRGFDLPPATFTHDQLDALAVGLSLVESGDDATLAAAAREVRAKLQAGLPDPELRRLADAPLRAVPGRGGTAPHLSTVRRAIRRREVLALDYADAAGRASRRDLHPLIVWRLPDGWMVSGWCALRAAFRTFRHDRIRALASTGARFAPDPDRSLAAFLALDACDGAPARPALPAAPGCATPTDDPEETP